MAPLSSPKMGSQIHPLWRVRLAAALRTAFACTIVGCTTFYSPKPIRNFLTYPSFSYMTTILIVSDATLGQSLMSCWHVLYATCQVMASSVPVLWLIGPARFTNEVAAVVVAVSVFLVALPGSTHLMTKRIAFGQFVNVYVGTVVQGAGTNIVLHPTEVAASTALGALASVLAMMFPYPRLAYYEVKKSWRLYAENASQRLSLLVEAISAEDNRVALESISQGKSLSKAASKLLQSVDHNLEEGMLWERPDIKFLRPNHRDLGHRLQEMEIPIRGMEMALSSSSSFPTDMIDEGLRDHLRNSQLQISLKLLQSKFSIPSEATTGPEGKREVLDKPLLTNKTTITTHQDLPALFFLYCMELLLGDLPIARSLGNNPNCKEKAGDDSQTRVHCVCKRIWTSVSPSRPNFIFALKCSIALGFAVVLGLIYNQRQGYWSGLTIAISFVTGRQATFTVANARAQGTAMGSVYGIICFYLFHSVSELRLLAILPWVVFTHFLRHSKMYGQAGGISAAIGALLILGREHYGQPSGFAIARLAEACIGLICFTVVEVLFYPMRAATLAKNQFAQSLGALRDCVQDINLCETASTGLREKHMKLKSHVKKLENFIEEAKIEPDLSDFWFLPFEGDCYSRILVSMSKMADLLPFVAHNADFISQKSEGASLELKQHSNTDLQHLKEKMGNSLKCLEQLTSMKSLAAFEAEVCDSEMGISPNPFMVLGTCDDHAEATVTTFVQHIQEAVVRIRNGDHEAKDVTQMVLCLSSLAFCIRSLSEETMTIKEEVRKLIK